MPLFCPYFFGGGTYIEICKIEEMDMWQISEMPISIVLYKMLTLPVTEECDCYCFV